MKIYPVDIIIRDVKTALDINKNGGTLAQLGDPDTLSVKDIIKSKILESVRSVHLAAPIHLVDGGYNFGDAVYWKEDGSGHVVLPEDFMRLIVFEMDDWDRSVFNTIDVNDPVYNRQSSRFKGVRGNPQKPVCAISWRPEGRVLEFYSSKSTDARVTKASYLPYPVIDDNDGVEICEKCYKAVIYSIAALACCAFEETDKANVFNELSKSSLI